MSFVTSYNSKVGLKLMLLLPVIIMLFLVISGFNTDVSNPFTALALLTWVFLFLNSILVSFGGYNLSRNFSSEIKLQTEAGFPVQSLDGFPETQGSIRTVFASSFFVLIIVFISLVTYISVLVLQFILEIPLNQEEATNLSNQLRPMVIVIALGLILIAIGIALLLRLPDKPALYPGALMKYFYPNRIPTQIDNFLGDTLSAFIDPITRLKWDDWSDSISNGLSENFMSNKNPSDRMAIAREKILLFAYLNLTMPKKVNEYVVKSELGELFSSQDALSNILDGKGSGMSWDVIKEIVDEIRKEAPEVFTVIDRLIIELQDNLKEFKDKDLWVTISVPDKVTGNRYPFRIMVFMLNKSDEYKDKKRPVRVNLINYDSGNNSTLPDSYSIHLDENEGIDITSDKLSLISSENEDIVGLVSRILQVGDAVWFQLYKSRFGYHIYNIRVEEEGKGSVYGSSMKIQLVRDISFYLKTYGGKISAIGGAVVPILAGALSFLSF